MNGLVKFFKINFALIVLCFFLPFLPFYACEKKTETSVTDSTAIPADTLMMGPSVENSDSVGTNIALDADPISISDTIINKNNKDTIKDSYSDSKETRLIALPVFSYLAFSEYSNNLSDRSITGFGLILFFIESIIEGEFDFFDWLSYLMPLSFLTGILGLLFSIKSGRRKYMLLFASSLVGLICISVIGVAVGNLDELLFGFWMVAILYLVNTLLSFILLKNHLRFSQIKK